MSGVDNFFVYLMVVWLAMSKNHFFQGKTFERNLNIYVKKLKKNIFTKVLMDKCPMDNCPDGCLSEWVFVQMDN